MNLSQMVWYPFQASGCVEGIGLIEVVEWLSTVQMDSSVKKGGLRV